MADLTVKSYGKINSMDIFPIPEGLDDCQSREWRVTHWGTKCIIAPEDNTEAMECLKYKVKRNSNGQMLTMTVTFITAWTPPLIYFRDLQNLYPKLKFHLRYDDYYQYRGTARTVVIDGEPYFDATQFVFGKAWTMKKILEGFEFLKLLLSNPS